MTSQRLRQTSRHEAVGRGREGKGEGRGGVGKGADKPSRSGRSVTACLCVFVGGPDLLGLCTVHYCLQCLCGRRVCLFVHYINRNLQSDIMN